MVLRYGRNPQEDSVMRQLVLAASGMLDGSQQAEYGAVLEACQALPIYRDLIEWSESELWPDELAELDDVFGLQLLRPWLNVQVASTRE